MASKALIVEIDQHGLIHALETPPKDEGFEVMIARNGVDALRIMHRERPDIVILDPELAWLGGERIRQTPRAGTPGGSPIIVLSPRTEDSERVPPAQDAAEDAVSIDTGEVLSHIRALQRRAESAEHKEILRAGTLEALAGRLAMDAVALARSAREGRLGAGPYVALGPVRSVFVHAEGGLKVDLQHRVLGPDDQPIPGLYAAGSTGQGGLLLKGHGHHLAWAFVSGRRAARIAAQEMVQKPVPVPATEPA